MAIFSWRRRNYKTPFRRTVFFRGGASDFPCNRPLSKHQVSLCRKGACAAFRNNACLHNLRLSIPRLQFAISKLMKSPCKNSAASPTITGRASLTPALPYPVPPNPRHLETKQNRNRARSMLFVFLLLRRGLSVFRPAVSHWLNMSVGISSETIIANGVVSPISVVSFPSMETLQTVRATGQPDVARSQIEIRATNDTDEFGTVPGVTVRNLDYRWCDLNGWRWRSHDHRCRGRNYQRLKSHCSIWINHTA